MLSWSATPVCIRPCVLGYCPAERWICLPVSVRKQTEPGFPLGFLPVLSSIPFLFILKNSLVLVDDNHTHNMMQSPPCSKIGVVLSDVLCWIFPKHNTLYSRHKVHLFANFVDVLLYCLIVNRMHVLEYFGVTTMLLIRPQFSPITAIQLWKCFKVTIGLMVKSLSVFLPLWQVS